MCKAKACECKKKDRKCRGKKKKKFKSESEKEIFKLAKKLVDLKKLKKNLIKNPK